MLRNNQLLALDKSINNNFQSEFIIMQLELVNQ